MHSLETINAINKEAVRDEPTGFSVNKLVDLLTLAVQRGTLKADAKIEFSDGERLVSLYVPEGGDTLIVSDRLNCDDSSR